MFIIFVSYLDLDETLMAISFNFELDKNPTRNKTYIVYLRITEDRKPKRIKTIVEINRISDFNKNGKKNSSWVKSSEPKAAVWNEELDNLLTRAKTIYTDLLAKGTANKENLARILKDGEKSMSFIKYAEKRTDNQYKTGGSYNTYTNTTTFLNKLKDYLNGKDLAFNEINKSFISDFKTHLFGLQNSKNKNFGYKSSYIKKLFDRFEAIYNDGVDELEIETTLNPFSKLDIKPTKPIKVRLNAEQIEIIKNLDLKRDSLTWHSRNYFLFSFYGAGVRAGDFVKLRQTNIDNGRLKYKMEKTGNNVSIKLNSEALVILSYYMDIEKPTTNYIFPLLSNDAPYAKAKTTEEINNLPQDLRKLIKKDSNKKNSLMNKGLKSISKMIGITETITFHVSRHSFANIARQSGASIYDISKALGHSSIKITEAYLAEFDTESQDKAIDKIFQQTIKEAIIESSEDERNLISLLQNTNISSEQEEAIRKILEKNG